MLVFPDLDLSPWRFAAMASASSLLAGLSALLLEGPARRLGLMAKSRRDRFSSRPVPLTGGVGLAVGMLAVLAVLGFPLAAGERLALGGLFAVGLLDDFRELAPASKFGLQAGIALLASFLLLPSPGLVGLGLLCFLVLVNASNYLDNMDALLAGVALIQAIALSCFHFAAGPGAALLLWALPGILLLAIPPARVYLGDAGSHLIGAAFAIDTLRLLVDVRGFHVARVSPLLFVFAVPLVDVATVTISRLRRRRPVFRGGTDHLSHRLVRAGFSPGRAVLLLVLASAVCGAAGLLLAYS